MESGGVWILGSFLSPQPIWRDQAAWYPRLCTWVEKDSGRLLNTTIFEDNIELMILDQTLRLIISTAQKPSTIVVEYDEMFTLLKPAMEKLNINTIIEKAPEELELVIGRISESINS